MPRKSKFAIVNGDVLPAPQAAISIEDRGFRYGDGVFETMAMYKGIPYLFDWHVTRLESGLKAIKIPFAAENLRPHCQRLLKENAVSDGLLRIQVTRGTAGRGYLPEPAAPTFVIETLPLSPVPSAAVTLWQSSYVKFSSRALPVQYKLCQGLNSTLARMESAEQECFDALLLNEHGCLSETSSANLFWFKDGILYTPSLSCGTLEGATRAAVIRLSPYPVKEVEAGIEALGRAEAVFITNTVWQAIAVKTLLPSGQRWGGEAIAQRFRECLSGDKEEYCCRHREEW